MRKLPFRPVPTFNGRTELYFVCEGPIYVGNRVNELVRLRLLSPGYLHNIDERRGVLEVSKRYLPTGICNGKLPRMSCGHIRFHLGPHDKRMFRRVRTWILLRQGLANLLTVYRKPICVRELW